MYVFRTPFREIILKLALFDEIFKVSLILFCFFFVVAVYSNFHAPVSSSLY